MEVRPRSFADGMNDPDFPALLDAYALESAILNLPTPQPHAESYIQLEQAGVMFSFGAYEGDKLIGFCNVLVSQVPHYSVKVGTMESWYVHKDYRFTGAGVALKHEAERAAEAAGAVGMFITAPINSDLAESMARHTPYTETNRVFFRRF